VARRRAELFAQGNIAASADPDLSALVDVLEQLLNK
jgi:hypothetical protein